MGALLRFYTSSVGAKIVMAVTGCLWFLFLVGHLVGNLQVFAGPEPLNAYAYFLHSHHAMLWTVRSGMFVLFVLHVWSASVLTLKNQASRPVAYVKKSAVRATWTSRNMYLTGSMILAFVGYHLLQFTWEVTNPEIAAHYDALGHHDVYRMVVSGFQNPAIAGLYIAGMVLLGLHLSHGVSSMFQSMGWNGRRANSLINALGPACAILLGLGNIAMPAAFPNVFFMIRFPFRGLSMKRRRRY